MITIDETMTEHCIVNCCMETNNSDVVGKVQLKVYVLMKKQQMYLTKGSHSSSMISRGTQREYSSKLLKHNIVKRILVFKR